MTDYLQAFAPLYCQRPRSVKIKRKMKMEICLIKFIVMLYADSYRININIL